MDLYLVEVQGTQESSPRPQFKSINSSVLSSLYNLTLTSTHNYWINQIYPKLIHGLIHGFNQEEGFAGWQWY